MDKKGFTLIELIVSVVLVSVVMVTLTATIVDLRRNSTIVRSNTNAVIYSSIISRAINNDIVANEGIRYIECDSNGLDCGIVLGNSNKRTIYVKDVTDRREAIVAVKGDSIINNVVDSSSNLRFKEDNENFYLKVGGKNVGKVELAKQDRNTVISDLTNVCKNSTNKIGANCLRVVLTKDGKTCVCVKEKVSRTLIYEDITDDKTVHLYYRTASGGKLKYIKTLSYTKFTDYLSNSDLSKTKVTTEGYTFSQIDAYQTETPYVLDSSGKTKNVFTRLSIGLYDGNDKNDQTYNIYLYSSSRTDNVCSVGDKYTIQLKTDNTLSTAELNRLTLPIFGGASGFSITRLVEMYNVGYTVSDHDATGEGSVYSVIAAINPPRLSGAGDRTFRGYYTQAGTATGDCPGAKIIDADGTFVAASNFFCGDATIYACWR